MKKSILNIGKALNKAEQKQVNGGLKPRPCCNPADDCCVPNPNYNGSNCQFIPGNPNAWPVPYCI
ncbi:hypothetical protein AAON49_13850 [Pseudotenacibaculum sp. MALMAid0570]|uniref:hypothetical protein n=1 Tax=Pseudotenacibaculum sp. MALMAid0570 TaxID=3143938 RepID=UPI0032DF5102